MEPCAGTCGDPASRWRARRASGGWASTRLNVRFTDALTMADRHAVYKQCLKEVADQLGVSVTFMAKFAEVGAGSSCHIHLSVC